MSDTTGDDSSNAAGDIENPKFSRLRVGVDGSWVVVLKTTFGRSFIITKGIQVLRHGVSG